MRPELSWARQVRAWESCCCVGRNPIGLRRVVEQELQRRDRGAQRVSIGARQGLDPAREQRVAAGPQIVELFAAGRGELDRPSAGSGARTSSPTSSIAVTIRVIVGAATPSRAARSLIRSWPATSTVAIADS
jgi:hypothetical protein